MDDGEKIMSKEKTHHVLQKIGAAAIAVALLLTWYKVQWYIILTLLVGIGIFDIVLVVMKKKTISQWIHKLFPQWGDMIVMVITLVITWIIMGPEYFVLVLMGVILGHFWWND